jgi:hypothetical protein
MNITNILREVKEVMPAREGGRQRENLLLTLGS